MCGIAGYLARDGEPAGREIARAMVASLAHRGPDDHGVLAFQDGRVFRGREWPAEGTLPQALLTHRRLSILDLAETGWQPMSTPDGRWHIVFNGEIYNYLELRAELAALGHRFRGGSDTEVLLAALAEWGTAVLPRLVGMFAFALLDARERTVTLARDFFGIKPLYYAPLAGALAFASEIKTLLEVPGVGRQANPRRVFEYLRFGLGDHGGETLLAGVRQVPAAHLMVVPLDRPEAARVERWWSLRPEPLPGLSFAGAAEQLRELFLDSVRLHLRSDVPVGAALSGGVDSAAIVMAMRHLEPGLEIHTFSYVADDPALSEERWVDVVAEAAGAVRHKVSPRPDDPAAELARLMEVQDEPFGSTSIYAQNRVFRLAAEAGIKVMLDGQGADEMLGGYPNFRGARVGSLLRQGKWLQAARFVRSAARLPGSSAGQLASVGAGLLLPRPLQALAARAAGQGAVPSWLRTGWLREHGVALELPTRPYGRDVLHARLRQAMFETSLPMLLRYEDRNSMAYSVESRVPFLTPQLAGFLASLPEEYLVGPDGTTKRVFREAMRGIVPDVVLDRRDKIGFATPEKQWLTSLDGWVEGVLGGRTAARVPVLDAGECLRGWRQARGGGGRMDVPVWRWVNLVRWAERFDVQFGAA